MKLDRLSSTLVENVEILRLLQDEDTGNFAWASSRCCCASVVPDTKSNLFSSVGIGARGATVILRPRLKLTLHQAMRWHGQFLFLTSIILAQERDRLEVKAALCEPVTLTAKPQSRNGRDALNRPTTVQQPDFTFPGILTEKYYQNALDEIYQSETLQRVLVTPKAIVLRPGDLVQPSAEAAYTVRQAMNLDPYKNEYVIERRKDI